MDILDIAIAKQLAGGGGGSGTDNYNDLSNLPKINDVTLSGNKSSSALGLQSEITSENKLDSDLIDDTNQDNKFVTSTEKNTWNAKQNAIDADHKINADYVDDSTSTNKFVTATDKETWNAKQNAIDNSHKLSSDLVDDTNHTNKFVTSTEKNTWNGKQNAIDSEHKLSSSLVSFTTAEAAALASGIDSAKVAQISTNQSNILSVQNATEELVDNGAKNVLHFESLKRTNVNYGRSIITNGVRFTINDDGTITVNRETASNEEAYIELCISGYDAFFADQYCDGEHYLSGCPSGGSDSTYRLYAAKSTYAKYDTGAGVLLTSTPITEISIVISVYNGYNAQNLVFKPMITTKSQFDISSAYQPYALPNYDLTRLEAEDRASLAEVVDSGAKNLFDLANATLTDISTTTHTRTATTLSVETTGVYGRVVAPLALKKGNYVFHAKISSYSPHTSANKAAIGINSDTIGTDTAYGFAVFTANGEYTIDFTLTSDATVYIGFTANNTAYAVSPAESFVASEIMVCTKAAFGVSKAFVPYRPNYDLVCDKVANFGITKIIPSFTPSVANTYECVTATKITLPANKVLRINVACIFQNSYATGIKLVRGTTMENAKTLAISESTADYNALPISTVCSFSSDQDIYVFLKCNSTGTTKLVMAYDII